MQVIQPVSDYALTGWQRSFSQGFCRTAPRTTWVQFGSLPLSRQSATATLVKSAFLSGRIAERARFALRAKAR